jgi:diguanylate cyclase (GGDEF)-like protein
MISAPALSELLHTAFTHDDPADDPAHLWRDVLHELARLFDADAALALRVENRDRVQVAATYRWPTPLTTDLIPVAPDSQAEFVLLNDGVHVIDVGSETRFVASSMLLDAGFRQSCSTRITANDLAVGLIGLQYRNPRLFTADEVGLFGAVCRLLGMLLGHGDRIRSHARLVDRDPLTDLLNRRRIFDVVDEALNDERAGTVILLDLDGFKAVNDTHGHRVGDLVLQVVSQRLARAVRPLDLVGRLSGDEFVVVVWDANLAEAEAIAERLVGHIEQAIPVPHSTVHISASAGIAPLGRYPTSIDIVGAADSAMYRAKSEGRGTVRLDEGVAEGRQVRPSISSVTSEVVPIDQVLVAINDLEIHFQPIVAAGSFTPVGLEALARGPRGSLRNPEVLFRAAETWGYLVELELRAKQLSFNQQLPPNRTLFVNIDPAVLSDPTFIDRLHEHWLRRHPSIQRLVVEITERHLQHRPGALINAVERFRRFGWQVALT